MRSAHEFAELQEKKKKARGRRGRKDEGKKREGAWIPKVATKQFKLSVARMSLSIIKSHG